MAITASMVKELREMTGAGMITEKENDKYEQTWNFYCRRM